ncbi:hypothetical protein EFO17_08005 [Lactococcus lactis]|uniref:hypothetical protein n=1 Tax=Lactococcus lactis TaxID=1358 RepID=UPI0021A46512|nr:hypothetical protein [Lactococcus lactis]MCT3130324.1 hypothetical protein [Lactococcus lactis]
MENFATEPSKESIDLLYRVQYLTDRGVYSNSSIEEAETYFEKALLNCQGPSKNVGFGSLKM